MNTYKIKLACVALFAVSAIAQAQTSDSSSGATSGSNSTSVGIGQGGGSSLNNVNATSSSNTKSTSTSIGGVALAQGGTSTSTSGLRNSGNSASNSNSAVRGSGNSAVTINLASGTGTGSSGTGTTGAANDAGVNKATVGDPGSSPYNTNSRVEYSGTQTVKTNPAIQAPGLTTTLSDTCMGSVSLGVSLPGFGATGGTTLVDQACVRRLDAREFRAMGLTDVALALLCQSDSNRRAVESTGHLCPGTTAPLAKVDGSDNNTGTVADDVKYRDPIVRRRMGLPPLSNAPYTRQQAENVPVVAPPAAVTPAPAPAPVVPAAKSTEPAATVMTMPVDSNSTTVAVLR
jgi:hypothetical protein